MCLLVGETFLKYVEKISRLLVILKKPLSILDIADIVLFVLSKLPILNVQISITRNMKLIARLYVSLCRCSKELISRMALV